MARGNLRVYLGAAPGVGKTFAMLNEGRRRHGRGTDVVVGFVETHGRPRTMEQIGDLEVVPRATLTYRGSEFEEMDVDAILARRPGQVLVDELAHTNVPGSRNEKRWQDVEELIEAGIDVISTVNIQHLESVNDVVERITGVQQRETLPDEVVRRADQVELVDLCGIVSGRDRDKFALTGLHPAPAALVSAPLIEECPINLECLTRHTLSLGVHELFIGEIVATHLDSEVVDGRGRLDKSRVHPLAYVDGDYWSLGEKVGSYGFAKKRLGEKQ